MHLQCPSFASNTPTPSTPTLKGGRGQAVGVGGVTEDEEKIHDIDYSWRHGCLDVQTYYIYIYAYPEKGKMILQIPVKQMSYEAHMLQQLYKYGETLNDAPLLNMWYKNYLQC